MERKHLCHTWPPFCRSPSLSHQFCYEIIILWKTTQKCSNVLPLRSSFMVLGIPSRFLVILSILIMISYVISLSLLYIYFSSTLIFFPLMLSCLSCHVYTSEYTLFIVFLWNLVPGSVAYSWLMLCYWVTGVAASLPKTWGDAVDGKREKKKPPASWCRVLA